MSDKHKGKTRIEFTPEEVESLLLLVNETIKVKPLLEVCNSPLPGLLMKLNRGHRRVKVSDERH